MTPRICDCGSGLMPSPHHDARNIFLCYACERCWSKKLAGYRPDVLTNPNYEADDLGDDDEDNGGYNDWPTIS